ncbi:alpha/beta hydrolase [Paraburkholderia guartelaensis]|uniref:Alpha/beta hydrolase n=1 Tax=Paraburkholderia guartelaensis TaxID=2546446 RepID=A0A4R5LK80_9BURK|nr:alpha/beta hydrolase [Paraburkholderia guartelaensis]TDG10060.1 alpha/beta hydrolase [Paraburkholderia guartelaensis]
MSTPSRIIDHGPASLPDPVLPGFAHRFETIEGTRLHYVIGGKEEGETVVLLAGYPESWFAWRKVMPLLAGRYRVIVPDLPGQGDSDRPQGGYDTQSLATALHALLGKLDARRYHLAAHDVGAWVAYPYAALFGDEVSSLALLDAGIPGITLPEALPVAPERAWRTWHFAFHAIPDLPELLIAGKERAYLDWFLRRKTANPQTFTDADIDEYLRVLTKEGGLRAGLAYYRAADVSARQNRELSTRGKLRMPVLALSADQGSIADMAGPLRAYADEVQGATLAHCGHFLPEEQPAAVAEALLRFFGQT